PEARQDWITFLLNTEARYWLGMARYLKEDLRERSLVMGTPVDQSPFPIQAQLDAVAVQGSWQPPHFPHKPNDAVDWKVQNVSLVSESDGGEIGRMAAQRIAGKPYICTQFSAAAPNTYSAEALLLLGAYAALQDWDAIFADNYASDLKAMKS